MFMWYMQWQFTSLAHAMITIVDGEDNHILKVSFKTTLTMYMRCDEWTLSEMLLETQHEIQRAMLQLLH